MKKFLFYSVLVFLFSCEEENIDPNLVESFSLTSANTGRDYTISVHLPEDYSLSANTYATLYVLDAEQDEDFVAITSKKVSAALNKSNVIVIGIRYKKDNARDIDYTPTVTHHGKGGSAAFLTFIKEELIPRIQTDYRADTLRSQRTIIGHSYGGLLGAYAFIKHNELFGNYLLLSPSLFYDNSIILQYEQQIRPSIKNKKQLVFVGAGSTEKDLLVANDLFYRRLVNFYPHTTSLFSLVPGKGHLASKNTDIEKAIHFYYKNR
ncbi:alpha/beta hydrolase [Adhaeribacter radiodurans]|uniref:Alpha/beta hydrolase n=1 Tax=Adhaeribacter radiodurans TaxID=2745197 RepID=A0A7L7L7C2_9BACT|nr:alpha/beta hydrolase-fold protein [Adhaeribacter radiodurans]QMU28742.1 alpha/beta hydrolase [Adhaeribacter radiodurans]